MAMGLGFLGRGRVASAWKAAALHVVGAALGGASLGAFLGGIGHVLSVSPWRSWIIAGAATIALYYGLRRPAAGLGLNRQVPRDWGRTMSAGRCYFAWGILLGCGVATVVPYSALLVILAAQLTSAVALAALSGAVFGAMRELLAVVPMMRRGSADISCLMDLLPKWQRRMRQLNVVWIIGAGTLLPIMAWH